MHPTTLSLMRDQVRAIYRAVTGTDMPEASPTTPEGAAETPEASVDEVARRFTELEALARSIPAVIERVPPFSFAPPLDALEEERLLLVELALPGVEKGDVSVERTEELLVVSGIRRGERAANGRTYLHAEIPRGPFHRVVRLPYATAGEPRVTLEDGVLRIQLSRVPTASA